MVSLHRGYYCRWMALILLGILLLSACTTKTNPTGNNWSDVRPISFRDSTSFVAGYSYPAVVSVKGNESNLLCGNWNGVEAVALMRFTGLPTEFSIPAGYQDSTYLELTLVKRSPLIRYPVNLSVYKLDQSWAAESTSLVQDAAMRLITLQEFTIPDTISSSGTEINIPIPTNEIEDWRSEADTLGLSLVVKTGAASYVEIRAAETGRGPQLRFKYRLDSDTAETEDREFKSRATRDSYRLDADLAPLLPDRWVISNFQPSRIYVNFALDSTLFQDNQGNQLDPQQYRRATINHAELVLFVKENPYYGSSLQYSLRGDRMNDSLDIANLVEITDAQTSTGLITQSFIRGDSLVVNITPIVQAWTSGDRQNFGVVIRSLHELLNFGELELWHFSDAPAGRKPKLRVTYTPPYL